MFDARIDIPYLLLCYCVQYKTKLDLSSVIQLSVLLQIDHIEICIACMQKVIFKNTFIACESVNICCCVFSDQIRATDYVIFVSYLAGL